MENKSNTGLYLILGALAIIVVGAVGFFFLTGDDKEAKKPEKEEKEVKGRTLEEIAEKPEEKPEVKEEKQEVKEEKPAVAAAT